jgi:hypothetical protein
MLRTTMIMAAVAGSVFLSSGTAQAIDAKSITDTYLFSTSLSAFEQARDARAYASVLDWSSDACSWSPDKPIGFDFTPGCHRHDFGYRNYKRQSRFTATAKARIDSNFYTDLKRICDGNWACDATAWTYYQAVKKLGS